MNDILSVETCEKLIDCTVFTSHTANPWFRAERVKIKRVGRDFSKNSVVRYIHYIWFNAAVFLKLLKIKPNKIVCYETLSIFPVYLYRCIRKNVQLHIHYHEYISLAEIHSSSKYYKFLHRLEKKLWRKEDVTISHTNEDRKFLFLVDYPFVLPEKIQVYPNLPPITWYEQSKELKLKNKKDDSIRLVHVGALGLDAMYVKEIVEWVINQKGEYELDFYVSNSTNETRSYLETICSENKHIRTLPAVKYYDLPETLSHYDIGLVLYKGHIPNYVYNVPNKVFEYLICGLEVWYSNQLISTKKFVHENNVNRCFSLDFNTLTSLRSTRNRVFNSNLFFEKENYKKSKIINQ